jgi:hypothetical protein
LEYALLVGLVAVVAFGSLVYLGQSAAGPGHLSQDVAAKISTPPSQAGGPSVPAWCRTGATGCTDIAAAGQQQTIQFWASGGIAPYAFKLANAPAFMSLGNLDAASGNGEAILEPACSDAGNYKAISIVVSDGSFPPHQGRLTFSLTVPRSSCT